MIRFITAFILIGISVACFFVFIDPLYGNISALKAQVLSYDQALNNSKILENERDKLTTKYNSINPEDLTKLQRFLPENIDNIRLILEIEKIASPYGMVLRDVKYNSAEKETTATATAIQGGTTTPSKKDYGIWDLAFSTSGSYNNFLNFTRDLENNLRLVDISSIQFLSNPDTRGNSFPSTSEIYKYDFRIKTYWLKN